MFTVQKIGNAFAVINWTGEIEIAYKNRKFAEQYAAGSVVALMNTAEDENARRDGIAAYLATRATRTPAIKAQLELF